MSALANSEAQQIAARRGRVAVTLSTLLSLCWSPATAGSEACRLVHGRMTLANGAPSVRIWVVGGTRVLGVLQPSETFTDLPPSIRRIWAAQGDEAMWRSAVYGDFEVCPVAPYRPGRMQVVRLKSALHLKLRRERPES